MAIDSAKALVAKLHSDKRLAAELRAAKDESDFLQTAKKHGYDVSLADFKAAVGEYRNTDKGKDLADKQLAQGAAGLSIVGVDYAFVGIQTTQS